MSVREDIPKKKPLTFGHCPKGGRGVQPKSKSFGVVFLGLSFGHFQKKGGGSAHFKSFAVFFRYFFICF